MVLKPLDGTIAIVYSIKPSTQSERYNCVKIHGEINPFAAPQDGGPLSGRAVLSYKIIYQSVGRVL